MTHPYLKVKSEIPISCTIVAVSKKQSVEKILQLYDLGHRHFGENYLQEALQKISSIDKKDIVWHFIGSLQGNKAKDVVQNFEYIHSVDRLSLATEINKQAGRINKIQKIFIQLNLADEDTKGGISESTVFDFIKDVIKLSNVQIVGLMTMPPLYENPEDARMHFKKMFLLQKEVQKKFPNICSQFKELSMGTSHDFKIAVKEGATFIRLGTILFGERI